MKFKEDKSGNVIGCDLCGSDFNPKQAPHEIHSGFWICCAGDHSESELIEEIDELIQAKEIWTEEKLIDGIWTLPEMSKADYRHSIFCSINDGDFEIAENLFKESNLSLHGLLAGLKSLDALDMLAILQVLDTAEYRRDFVAQDLAESLASLVECSVCEIHLEQDSPNLTEAKRALCKFTGAKDYSDSLDALHDNKLKN